MPGACRGAVDFDFNSVDQSGLGVVNFRRAQAEDDRMPILYRHALLAIASHVFVPSRPGPSRLISIKLSVIGSATFQISLT